MKHELLAILKEEGFKDDIGHPLENNLVFQKLVALIPDDATNLVSGGVVGVSETEVKLVKMQTLHQLLVEQTSYRVSDAEDAAKLAQMVDAAYNAINGTPPVSATPSSEEAELENAGFSAALLWMKDGKTVSRNEWCREYHPHWVALIDVAGSGKKMLVANKRSGGVSAEWRPSLNDLLATDWYVVS